jgi:hypothetical protein
VFSVRSAYRLALTRALNLEEEGSSTAPRGGQGCLEETLESADPTQGEEFPMEIGQEWVAHEREPTLQAPHVGWVV